MIRFWKKKHKFLVVCPHSVLDFSTTRTTVNIQRYRTFHHYFYVELPITYNNHKQNIRELITCVLLLVWWHPAKAHLPRYLNLTGCKEAIDDDIFLVSCAEKIIFFPVTRLRTIFIALSMKECFVGFVFLQCTFNIFPFRSVMASTHAVRYTDCLMRLS